MCARRPAGNSRAVAACARGGLARLRLRYKPQTRRRRHHHHATSHHISPLPTATLPQRVPHAPLAYTALFEDRRWYAPSADRLPVTRLWHHGRVSGRTGHRLIEGAQVRAKRAETSAPAGARQTSGAACTRSCDCEVCPMPYGSVHANGNPSCRSRGRASKS